MNTYHLNQVSNSGSLLIWTQRPAKIELRNELPDSLETGAFGGFHPFGMWDPVIDSNTLTWCGLQYFLSSDEVERFLASNRDIDNSVLKIWRIEDVYDDQTLIEQCSENNTSHILRLSWTQTQDPEIIPTMAFNDNWYAYISEDIHLSKADRFEASCRFCAVGISDFLSISTNWNLDWPTHFSIPLVDNSG